MSTIGFSIIIVCLNAGDSLLKTVNSILSQQYDDYQIIIKDGGSTDGSLQQLPMDKHIELYECHDNGIYDAMNQAIDYVKKEYVLFINAGDLLYNNKTLEQLGHLINAKPDYADIYYGDVYSVTNDVVINSPHKVTEFMCYRTTICHQACVYRRQYLEKERYDTRYRITADYEQFVRSYMKCAAQIEYVPLVIARYLGGGFSETKENQNKAKGERKQIIDCYFGFWKKNKYNLTIALTFKKIRIWLSKSKRFSPYYELVKKKMYGKQE